MVSREVIKFSNRFTLIKPALRNSWPWAVKPNRILVLFLPWLNSKEKHISKYVDLYSDLGLDVLCMQNLAKDFLWPPESMKACGNLINILQRECKDYDLFFIHSMSVGAFNLTSFRMLANEHNSSRPLLDKIAGVIYDSVVVGAGKGGIVKTEEEKNGKESTDALDLMVRGLARSVSDSKFFFLIVNMLTKSYLLLTRSKTLDFYKKAYDVVREEPIKKPTLFFASKNDRMSDYKVVEQLAEIYKNDHSVPVRVKIWDESGHAQHLVYHRKEYMDIQKQFMSDIFGKSKL